MNSIFSKLNMTLTICVFSVLFRLASFYFAVSAASNNMDGYNGSEFLRAQALPL